MRWADGRQLTIALQKSSVTLFNSDTHQSRLHPQMRIGDAVAPLNRTPKILGVTLDTHFTFAPHARDCVERASRALKVMKATAGSNWGFTTETLVATYKAIVRPILNYPAPIWFTQLPSSHLYKLEVIQNKVLRIATGCHQKAAVSHLRAETGVLPLRAHLELCSQQFYASAFQPLHPQSPNRHLPTRPPPPQGYPPGLIPPSCEAKGDDSNPPLLILGGVLKRMLCCGFYPMNKSAYFAGKLKPGKMRGSQVRCAYGQFCPRTCLFKAFGSPTWKEISFS